MKRVVFRARVPASGLLQRQHIVFLLRQPRSRMLHLAPVPTSREQDDALLAHFVQRSVPPSSPLHKEAEKVGMMRKTEPPPNNGNGNGAGDLMLSSYLEHCLCPEFHFWIVLVLF